MISRLYVAGSTGKVGRAWARLFQGTSTVPQVELLGGSHEIDLRDAGAVAKLAAKLRESKGALLVLAAGMTNVDACEQDPEGAEQVNVAAVKELAKSLKSVRGALLFYSSDFVFDGKGPRGEEDHSAALSVYGQTKVYAEAAIRESGVEHLIVRINVPLAAPEDGENFYSFVAGHLKAGKSIRIVVDQWSNPLDTDRIANWSWQAWQKGVRRTLHLGGGTYATRFDIARFIAEYVGADTSLIEPIRTEELHQVALRPKRGGLLIAKQCDLFGTAPDLPTILKSLPK